MSPLPRRAVLLLAPLVVLAACRPDAVTVPSSGPPSGPPPSRSYDADLDSLFGRTAPAIAAAVAAQRATLAQAADSVLSATAATGSGLTAARLAPALARSEAPRAATTGAGDDARPLPIHWQRSGTTANLEGDAPWETTVTETLDATLVDGTLSVVGTERVVTRNVLPTDPREPRHSEVSETRTQLDIPVCPDPAGVARGRWSSSERTWQTRASVPLAGPATHDALTELTAEGTTAVQVRDDAEIGSYDVDLRIEMRKWRAPGNRPIDRRGGVRLRRREVAPDRLSGALSDAWLEDRTGDYDLLRTVGVGPDQFQRLFHQRVRAAYSRAREAWRRGDCVEVIPARGAAGGSLDPHTTVELGPEARHRQDGSTVAPATLDATASAGTIAAPAAGVPHPATFRFTSPAQGGARVQFRAVSRRGIGFGSVAFAEAGASVGRLTYDAAVTYGFATPPGDDQTVTGTLGGTTRVESDFRLELAARESDGTLRYRVLATNRIAVSGRGEITGTRGSHTVTYAMMVEGQGTSHNPAGPTDLPIVAGNVRAPEQAGPSRDAGTLTVRTRNGRRVYELRLAIGQIAPNHTWSRRSQLTCAGSIAVVTRRYDNATRASTVEVDDPKRCYGNYGLPSTDTSPVTFGAIGVDNGTPDPVTGSSAMISGVYDAGTVGREVSGTRTVALTACTNVLFREPLQLGNSARWQSALPTSLTVATFASCNLQYTLAWTIPLPAEARQSAAPAATSAVAAAAAER